MPGHNIAVEELDSDFEAMERTVERWRRLYEEECGRCAYLEGSIIGLGRIAKLDVEAVLNGGPGKRQVR